MPSPIIDGSAVTGIHTGAGNCVTAGLTTSTTNDIIVVVSQVEVVSGSVPNVIGVSGGGLSFSKRSSALLTGSMQQEVWWAFASSTLSSSAFTVSYSATYDNSAVIAFAVKGCNTSAPWDGNVSLPKAYIGASNPATFTISTSQADDLLLMFLGGQANQSSYAEPSGWSLVGNILNSGGTFYCWAHASKQSVSSTQSSATFTATTTSGRPIGVLDALTADASVTFDDLAGNLGGSSQYGKLSYGLKSYSRISAFAPVFAGDLSLVPVVNLAGGLAPTVLFAADIDVHVNLIDLAGGITPQIVLGGPLTVLSLGLVFDGSLSVTPVLGASSFVSGPLWADTEPCPPPFWAPSEPCPPSPWMVAPPCDSVVWTKSRMCADG